MQRNPVRFPGCSVPSHAIPPALFLTVLFGFTTLLAAAPGKSVTSSRGEGSRPGRMEASSAPDDTAAVRRVLEDQAAAWNRGDLEGFTDGYWKSEATAFSGTQGTLRGWQALVERYHRAYPDRKAMGTLTFSKLDVNQFCADAALVLGQWHLDREAGPIGGVFSLVLRRFPEGWRIIADHTSVVPAPDHASRE